MRLVLKPVLPVGVGVWVREPGWLALALVRPGLALGLAQVLAVLWQVAVRVLGLAAPEWLRGCRK